MEGERQDQDGRRAIFSAPAGTARPSGSRGEGRRALFSAPEPPPEADPQRALVVHCSRCRRASPVGLASLGRHLLPSVWWPLRRHPVLMRCPSCRRTAWCRIATG